MRNAIILLFITFLVGCATKEQPYFKELNRSGEGVFRGFNIKDGAKKIKSIENEQYLEVDESVYMKYIYPFDVKDENKGRYEIEYYFDGEDQLHEVIINIFISDKAQSKELFETLRNEFTGIYGDFRTNKDGYIIWQGKTENTDQLEIAMIDDSKNNESTGYITLQINDFDY